MRTAVRPRQYQLLLRTFSGRAGTLVELGVDWGLTTRILAGTFKENRVVAVDSWDPRYHSEIMPDRGVVTAEDKYRAVLGISDEYGNVEVVRADVVECAERFTDPVCGIFFDAAHEEEPILREFGAWLPKIHPAGVAVVHDANKPGVARACDRVMVGHFFEHGMCVWDRRTGARLKE